MNAKNIKILVEAGPAIDSNKSGVGYYVKALLAAMDKSNGAHTIAGYYFNFLNRNNKKPKDSRSVAYKQITFIPGKIIPIIKLFGRLPFLELFVREKYDIVLFTNYVSLPTIRKTPKALIVYDLGFIDTPQYIKENNLTYLLKYSSRSIKSANLIITISDFTKNRILDVFPNTKADIIVTPIPPITQTHSESSFTNRLKDLQITNSKYILFLSTLEPRKNVVNLVNAYINLPINLRKEYSLVLAGGKGWHDEEIIAAINSAIKDGNNIIVTGYISDEEKNALYSNASIFVMPSHYEGFGMPILEAMQYNIPIAVSDIPVFHEVAGDSVVYFDKDNPDDIAENITNYLNDDAKKQKLIATYSECLNRYSWENNAKIVFNAFEKLVK